MMDNCEWEVCGLCYCEVADSTSAVLILMQFYIPSPAASSVCLYKQLAIWFG